MAYILFRNHDHEKKEDYGVEKSFKLDAVVYFLILFIHKKQMVKILHKILFYFFDGIKYNRNNNKNEKNAIEKNRRYRFRSDMHSNYILNFKKEVFVKT